MSYLDLRRWKKTIQSDKKMLKFVEEKHVNLKEAIIGNLKEALKAPCLHCSLRRTHEMPSQGWFIILGQA